MSLQEYARKRDFKKTAEPDATLSSGKTQSSRFVIQKHEASRLHYDLRLEMGGTLKSWAVPKGLPYGKGEKHLAVHVEDHPVAYIDFEGTIPKGQYGGGTVMIWDEGTYEPLSNNPEKELEGGKLHFILSGSKLNGEWYLVRLRDGDEWLVIKGGADIKPVSKKSDDTSVSSGKNMKELAMGDRVWQSNKTSTDHTQINKKAGKLAKADPLPAFIEPMKARLASAPPAHGDWLYEIKFDGWRALALKGGSQTRLLSRNEKDLGGKFPEIMESIAALKAREAIVDGEIVALDEKGRSSFQLLQAYDMGEERPNIFYYVFDLVQLNGRDLRKLPLTKRKAMLEKLLSPPPGVIRYSGALGTEAPPLLVQAEKLGLEGLIGKKVESHYESGNRSGSWIKLKSVQEQEFVIGGYTDPAGSRKHLGALIVGFYKNEKLHYASKVGTGFSSKSLRSMHEQLSAISSPECPFVDLPEKRSGKWGQSITASEMKRCHWVTPKLVCQIKFSEWTRDEHLRQPVFLGMRADKNPLQVIHEKAF